MPEVFEPPPGPNPTDYDRMVMQLAIRRMPRAANHRLVRDSDEYSAGWCGLMEASQRFQPWRGIKFTTYAYRYIDGYILTMRERRTKQSVPLLHFPERIAASASDNPLVAQSKVDLESALARLTEKQRHIVEAVIVSGQTQRQYARDEGISRFAMQERLRSAIKTLRVALGVLPPQRCGRRRKGERAFAVAG